jgi:hypothetical protein
LEDWSSTIELHPPEPFPDGANDTGLPTGPADPALIAEMVEGAGFEPAYAIAGRFTVCCL